MTALSLVPVSLAEARDFVGQVHRHLPKVVGGVVAVGVARDGRLVGVAVMGRPVAVALDDGLTLEVTRCAVREGEPNACSMLYGAARRVAKALGYATVQTYTSREEGGASLRAAGWVRVHEGEKVRWAVAFVPRARGTSSAETERQEARRLRAEGLTVRAIAERLGRSKSHVGRLVAGVDG